MAKPRKATKKAKTSAWSNKRIQIIAASVIGALIVFGLVIPLGAMQMENHDSFCASCHTEGEQTFFDRSLVKADASTDLASFHAAKKSARCIDCHTTPGIAGRYGGLMAGATDLISFYSGHYPQPAALEGPMGDGNCTKCHADVAKKQDFKNHFHVFLAKWQAADPKAAGCVDCHASHDTTNDTGAGFLNKTKTTQVCQKCHAAAGTG
jgi:predicted CXXCH cytochrome family protein